MAALDNVNKQQFPRMSIGQLKRLRSIHGDRVADHLPAKLAEATGAHWDGVREAIRNGTIDPVHVQIGASPGSANPDPSPFMGEGHHRLAIAESMGETSMPVSNNQADANRHRH